ncbi:MAG: hypothetical protein H0T92_15145 [Pyrinomonadaceae bacterium]|nr:hypothetical protein [Pyrinomonadaceae bacterium]
MPHVKGHLRLPNQIVDHLLPMLDPFEQAVYVQLYRLSWGFNKPTCSISLPKLSDRTKVPLSTLKKVLGRLQSKSLIEKAGMTIGFGKDQGIEYRVLAGSSQLAESSQPPQSSQLSASYSKRKELINKHTHKDARTQKENESAIAQKGVRVGSKFSLEECRRYAEHLHKSGQGIDRPGGYATAIYRTGEADELIEKFINPPASPALADASQCPDCNGTGWWYPKGAERGVARCKHERLTNTILEDVS